MASASESDPRDSKRAKIIKTIATSHQIDDGRPEHDQFKYMLGQLPAFLRHLPAFLKSKGVRQVNPKKHYVWLFDNIAFRAASVDQGELSRTSSSMEDSLDSDNSFFKRFTRQSDQWQVEYSAAFFKRKGGAELAEQVARVAHDANIDPDGLTKEMVQDRIQHFVDSVLPGHVIQTSIDRRLRHLHGPSNLSGFAHTLCTIPAEIVSKPVAVNTFPGATGAKSFITGTTYFAEPDGWGIISDVDDTIKVTMTSSPLGILKSTFLEHAEPVEGMPQLYSALNALLQTPPFFYVSASPYNLYPFLRQFREKYYPPGQIMLREDTWQNIAGLIGSLTQNVQAYKVEKLKKIHSWFPRRTFILIGDSTQKDPESYGEIERAYPDWVKGVFIRRVRNISEGLGKDEEERNSDARFEAAFAGVERSKWHVFDRPEEVEPLVQQIVNAHEDDIKEV